MYARNVVKSKPVPKQKKNHIQAEHEEVERRERSCEVCWHWRQGQTNACKNGPRCQWKERGQCRYFHQGVGVQKPPRVQEVQGGRQGHGGDQGAQQNSPQINKICRWNEGCFRKSTCTFIHTSSQDFPRRQQGRLIVRNQNGRYSQGRN